MKIITEIRRENLLRLVDQCGSLAAISEAIGKKRTDPTLRQIKIRACSPKVTVRNMGHFLARLIEEKLNLPSGWMDQDHSLDDASPEERLELRQRRTKSRTFSRAPTCTVSFTDGKPDFHPLDEVRYPSVVYPRLYLADRGFEPKDLKGLIAGEDIPEYSICSGDIVVINTAAGDPRRGTIGIYAFLMPGKDGKDAVIYAKEDRAPTGGVPIGKVISVSRFF